MIDGSSQCTCSIPPCPARDPHRGLEPLVGEAEVVDHERLEGGHPGGDEGGKLGERIALLARQHRVQADVDRRLAGGPGSELVKPDEERGRPLLADAGARVVEAQHRRRPPVGGGDGIGQEAAWLVGDRQAQVGVDVDDAGQDEQPGRVDGASRRSQVGADRHDAAIQDAHVHALAPGGANHRAAADDGLERGHRAART